MVPSEKLSRGPQIGTPWRRANWRFLQQQVARLKSDALILDVGAGRGDFADLFENRHYLALDVYPYPEVDIVCDLTQVNPFRPGSFDAILLLNVMEHVYDTRALLDSLAGMLKPGGVILVAIPFLVKIHQAPIDFVRYTHYALERLAEGAGLQVDLLEGYYDPVFFLGEGTGNLRHAVLPTMKGWRRYLAGAGIAVIEGCANLLNRLYGAGKSLPPEKVRSSAPTGYQVVYRKGVL
jgi:SAM-dependent methyltransferase